MMGSMVDMLSPTIAPDSENKKDECDNYRGGRGNRNNGKRPSNVMSAPSSVQT
jgi:hypothetical protein